MLGIKKMGNGMVKEQSLGQMEVSMKVNLRMGNQLEQGLSLFLMGTNM